MKRRLRAPSPAFVVSLIAVFIALGGTSYAAITVLPQNSVGTKQLKNGAVTKTKISKKTITQLKGNRGPAGPAGATGPPGSQGVPGPAGPFPSGNAPSGITIRGNYALGSETTTGFAWDNVTFGFQFSAAPAVEWHAAGAPATTNCPGTAANPQATAGFLCVYEGVGDNIGSRHVFNPITGAGDTANRWGAGLDAQPSAAARWFSYGTWAATSP
jgi:hypothetical protein